MNPKITDEPSSDSGKTEVNLHKAEKEPAGKSEKKAPTAKEIAYVENQLMPWLTEHLRMRSIGFQVFPAVQAGIFVALANVKGDRIVAGFGLATCISFWLWDIRNISIFLRLHNVAWDVCEEFTLKGRVDGVHKGGVRLLTNGYLKNLGSHTAAIRVMIVTASICWILVLAGYRIKFPDDSKSQVRATEVQKAFPHPSPDKPAEKQNKKPS